MYMHVMEIMPPKPYFFTIPNFNLLNSQMVPKEQGLVSLPHFPYIWSVRRKQARIALDCLLHEARKAAYTPRSHWFPRPIGGTVEVGRGGYRTSGRSVAELNDLETKEILLLCWSCWRACPSYHL